MVLYKRTIRIIMSDSCNYRIKVISTIDYTNHNFSINEQQILCHKLYIWISVINLDGLNFKWPYVNRLSNFRFKDEKKPSICFEMMQELIFCWNFEHNSHRGCESFHSFKFQKTKTKTNKNKVHRLPQIDLINYNFINTNFSQVNYWSK